MDPFLQANAELNIILNSAKEKRKLVKQHKKRIREHMQEKGLCKYKLGEFEFTLKMEDKCKFTKKGFLEWLENLPGEEPDEILSVVEDYESEMTESREVFKCKRLKTEE
tara:strand:+ start:158 stop:484 length:327 start_codon:yes stop_codon:yes gene_type:complete